MLQYCIRSDSVMTHMQKLNWYSFFVCRKQAKVKGQFKNLVKGAKKGAVKGLKGKKKR